VLSDGRAFVGNAAMNFLNICRIKHRPIYAEDFEKVYESWKKIIEYGAKIIYPAHGKPFSGEKLELQLEKRGK
jgi:glyoxylase-like metal-dependent hydrolase (beta-lactamase superfamily II)